MSGSAILGGEPLLDNTTQSEHRDGNSLRYHGAHPNRYGMVGVDDKGNQLSDNEQSLLRTLQASYQSESSLTSSAPRFEFQVSGDQIRVSMHGGSLADQLKFATAVRPLEYENNPIEEPRSCHPEPSYTNIASRNSGKSPVYPSPPQSPPTNTPPYLVDQNGHSSSTSTISSSRHSGSFSSSVTLQHRSRTSQATTVDANVAYLTLVPPPFQPSRALGGGPREVNTGTLVQAARAGIWLNPNYQGDINPEQLFNATTPDDQTTSLIITGIPVGTSLRDIFALICEGKVFAFSTKAPIAGVYDTYAATLAFTTRQAAEAFKAKSKVIGGLGGIYIHGTKLHVAWNRDLCRPQPYANRVQSRVVQFKGPEDLLSGVLLDNFFRGKMWYDLVGGHEWITPYGERVVEVAFSCIRGQSRAALLCFRREFIERRPDGHLFEVQYAPDPCDPLAPQDPNFWWEGRRF